ncbi:hypothetical protein [Ruminococcus sp.]|uniref:hypothetical protein n=1 Tax=Ruminococcus sp. TaxID=41978 RepID=UPI0025F935DD|nr:hypothetical protein [Ruminococcus sp.]
MEKRLEKKYTCEEILDTLKAMNFADVQEQGYIPLYERNRITDDFHKIGGVRTDFDFITKQKIKNIEKLSKHR